MDTRVKMYLLIDYEGYYGVNRSFSDAEALIQGIPSETLLNYIAGFNVNLYLNENAENTGKIQFYLVDSLLGKCDDDVRKKWASFVQAQGEKGFSPIMFWNYSNLLYYGLIFKTFNSLPGRDLTNEEAKKVFDSYLIINGIANSRVKIDEKAIETAQEAGNIEEVTMPHFIYQKDYASSTDFTNQVTRGAMFFQYLENHPKYNTVVQEYYRFKNVSGYLRMYKNLLTLFTELKIENLQRNQLAILEGYYASNEIDKDYIDTLVVNSEIASYQEDQSFSILRNRFLYRAHTSRYFILDVNFLLDQFYKAQVFAFNNFLKGRKIKADFLSDKGREFSDSIYLRNILQGCFPYYVSYFGEQCPNSAGEELSDAYLREEKKVCIIEFKDVLLNAGPKNSGDKTGLFAEFDKKFVANQNDKAKGITQLINAITDIDINSVVFDKNLPNMPIEIYPVIIYTDNSFGIEGTNKIYKTRFREEVNNRQFKTDIKDVTFINLNFFEIREDYLNQRLLDLFTMLDSYHAHTSMENFQLTSFEVFSKFYINENSTPNLALPSRYRTVLSEIIKAPNI